MGKNEVKVQIAKKKKAPKLNTTYNDEVKNILIILVIVVAILAIFYFVTGIITGEIKFGKKGDNETETKIQYDQILAGESFNQPKTEYIVFYFNMKEADASTYSSLLTSYKSKVTATRSYTVNLANGMNQLYIAGEDASNPNVTNANELKVKDPTIIRLVNGKVTQYIEGKDNVVDFFKNATN